MLRDWIRIALVVLGILTVIFIEFVFDKPQYYPALRIAMIAEAAAACVLLLWRGGHLLAGRIALAAVLAAGAIILSAMLGQMDADTEAAVLYAMMATALAGVAAGALRAGAETPCGTDQPA